MMMTTMTMMMKMMTMTMMTVTMSHCKGGPNEEKVSLYLRKMNDPVFYFVFLNLFKKNIFCFLRKSLNNNNKGNDSDEEEEMEDDEDDYIKPYDELPYSEGDDYEKMEIQSITPPDLFSDNDQTKHQLSSSDVVVTPAPVVTLVTDENPALLSHNHTVDFTVQNENDAAAKIELEDEEGSQYEGKKRPNSRRNDKEDDPEHDPEHSSRFSAHTKKSKNSTTRPAGHDTKHHRYVSRYRWKPKRLKYGMRQRKKQMELEKQQQQNRHLKKSSKYKEYKKKYQQLREWKFPNLFKVYWIIQWLGWLQISLQALFITSYGGISIFKGDPNASQESPEYKAFMDGVRFITTGLVLQGVVSMLFSSILPYVNTYFGTMRVYVVGELSMSLCGVCLFATENDEFGMRLYGLFALYGIFLQIHYNNYWILVEKELRALKHEDKRGYIVGIFNLSLTYSAIIVSLFGGAVLNIFKGSFLATIVVWSLGTTVGMLIAYVFLFIEVKKREKRKEEKRNLKLLIKTERLEHLIEKLEQKQKIKKNKR
ncbi:hypothetical protein RFI_09087 [Reticulomyxa filosa]|uniref:Uncharacterized protein n=1 Tax=Reticulomyxa filosa TaxID=46433 RepID=X6NP43_RETFI|nr:hypothetical protein RFI_09087 [Reticulomyxa filosa]|eukprot:ETO28045.1 hypothetical protein RFI_09087 [Reticulomyxa filosa]